jgi:hypothetical protein
MKLMKNARAISVNFVACKHVGLTLIIFFGYVKGFL